MPFHVYRATAYETESVVVNFGTLSPEHDGASMRVLSNADHLQTHINIHTEVGRVFITY